MLSIFSFISTLLCVTSSPVELGLQLEFSQYLNYYPTDLNMTTNASIEPDETSTLIPMRVSEIVTILKNEGKFTASSHPYFQLLDDIIWKQQHEETDCKFVESFFAKNLVSNSFSFIFSDLCNQVFKYDIDDDTYKYDYEDLDDTNLMKLVINNHLEEDGSHLELWLNDWIELNLDNINMSKLNGIHELLLFYIGQKTRRQRNVLYDIMRLDAEYNGRINPLRRFILIIMIEHSGKLLFSKTTKLYNIYSQKCANAKTLKFWSHAHNDVETGDLFLRNRDLNYYGKKLFYDQIIYDENEIELLLNIGRSAYNKLENINGNLDQFYDFITDEYKHQNIWNF